MVFFFKLFFFSALTPSVKPLMLISVIGPIGMFDLSSTLGLTPSIKGAIRLASNIDGNFLFYKNKIWNLGNPTYVENNWDAVLIKASFWNIFSRWKRYQLFKTYKLSTLSNIFLVCTPWRINHYTMINIILMVQDEPTLLLFYQNFMSNIKI